MWIRSVWNYHHTERLNLLKNDLDVTSFITQRCHVKYANSLKSTLHDISLKKIKKNSAKLIGELSTQNLGILFEMTSSFNSATWLTCVTAYVCYVLTNYSRFHFYENVTEFNHNLACIDYTVTLKIIFHDVICAIYFFDL